MVVVYNLSSKESFIGSNSVDALHVFTLEDLKSPVTRRGNVECAVGPNLQYNGLEVWDKVFTGPELSGLIEKLGRLRLAVNREGVCLRETPDDSGSTSFFQNLFIRLTDLFDWSKYTGVERDSAVPTAWSVRDVETGDSLLDLVDAKKLDEKEEQMITEYQSLTVKLQAAEESLKEAKNVESELRDKLVIYEKEKDKAQQENDELRLKLKSCGEENDELRMKSEDFQKRENEAKKVEEELRQSNGELSLDCQKKESEAKKVEIELRSKLENLEKQVELLQKEQNTNVEGSLDPYLGIILRKRVPFPPQNIQMDAHNVTQPAVEFPWQGKPILVLTPTDTDRHAGFTSMFFRVYVSSGRQFDTKNWWTISATRVDDKDRLLCGIYYDGGLGETEAYGIPVNIPFPKGATLRSAAKFQVGLVRGIGLRLLVIV